MTIGPVAVSDQVVWCFIPREGIGDLMGDPLGHWIGRHRERYQPPPLVPEDDQHEEQLEADRRHDQEVHGGNACRMVVEKGLPSLRPPSPAFCHVFGDCRLRDLYPELQQFAMDARRTPKPVRQADVPDQAADLRWYLWPTTTRARLPAPVQSEAHPMPPNNGLRSDNRDCVQHRRKQAIEPDKEQSVRHRQLWLRGCALTQHIQLMPQQYDLGFQPRL